VLIRPARADELPQVGELTVQAYVADGLLPPDHWYLDELRDAASRATDAELVVAADGEQLLGTVTFCLPGTPWAEIARPGEAEFRMLAVSPDARSRGAGRLLAQWCVDRAREQGTRAIALSTQPEMATAHRLYESMGFTRAPDRDWRPHPEVLLLAYVLDLTPA
jgi:ribosomal protein S18 acetylase RimI-like enzyme